MKKAYTKFFVVRGIDLIQPVSPCLNPLRELLCSGRRRKVGPVIDLSRSSSTITFLPENLEQLQIRHDLHIVIGWKQVLPISISSRVGPQVEEKSIVVFIAEGSKSGSPTVCGVRGEHVKITMPAHR